MSHISVTVFHLLFTSKPAPISQVSAAPVASLEMPTPHPLHASNILVVLGSRVEQKWRGRSGGPSWYGALNLRFYGVADATDPLAQSCVSMCTL
jgi:hypothetical protein